MNPSDEFKRLISALNAAGRFTFFRKDFPGGMLECVERRNDQGVLCGKNILVAQWQDRWIVSTHAYDDVFVVPAEHDVVDVVLDFLCLREANCLLFPSDFLERHGLRRLPTENEAYE
jgi:hypothetical protein